MISVITPTYNRGTLIIKLLTSLFDVSFPVQHIIVDNNSKDNTPKIINDFRKNSKCELTYIRTKCTQTQALNIGLKKAKFPWIGWINSDDYYTECGLDLLRKSIKQNPDVAFGGMIVKRFNGNSDYMPPHTLDTIRRKLPTGCRIWQPTVLLKKSFINEVGGWNKNYEYTQDYWLWAQAYIRNKKLVRVDAPIAVLVDHPNRLTRAHMENKNKKLKARFHRERDSVVRLLQNFLKDNKK